MLEAPGNDLNEELRYWTKKDLIELNNSITFDGNFMNITVQLRGDDFQKDEFFSWAAINR